MFGQRVVRCHFKVANVFERWEVVFGTIYNTCLQRLLNFRESHGGRVAAHRRNHRCVEIVVHHADLQTLNVRRRLNRLLAIERTRASVKPCKWQNASFTHCGRDGLTCFAFKYTEHVWHTFEDER